MVHSTCLLLFEAISLDVEVGIWAQSLHSSLSLIVDSHSISLFEFLKPFIIRLHECQLSLDLLKVYLGI